MSEVVKWFFVAWYVLGALLTVVVVGKPRKPWTPGQAAVAVALNAVFIVLIVVFWGTA